jgi:hypothetical protein
MRWLLAVLALAAPAGADVVSARFADPTDRYPHNVLGDIRGWGRLDITRADGSVRRIVLPDDRVFEDIAPRLWDVTGDGRPEVVVIEADATRGARLVVQGARGLIAASDFIGMRFRWLAPLGVGDVMGNGGVQIAWVETPHLGRTLRLGALKGERIEVVASLPGITAHRIGDEFIAGGLRACAPEIVALSPDWVRVLRVGWQGGRLVAQDAGPNRPGAWQAALRCP